MYQPILNVIAAANFVPNGGAHTVATVCDDSVAFDGTCERSATTMCLAKNGYSKINAKRGSTIICEHGTLWITADDSIEDVVLEAGQTHTVARAGRVMIEAFEASSCRIANLPGSIEFAVRRSIERFTQTLRESFRPHLRSRLLAQATNN